MARKIIHISGCDKFIPPFIELIKENFNFEEHEFLLTGGMAEEELIKSKNVHLAKKGKLARLKHCFNALIKMHQADKVILHGLFDIYFVIILFFTPWLLKKCYWVMWGGDLYVYQLGERNWKWKVREFFRRPVIKNMGYFTTTVPGDFVLAQKWYGTKAKWIHNLMYPSHLCRDTGKTSCKKEKNNNIFIQIGNSADPTNNHIEVIDKLEKYKNENIRVYCPLSYGSEAHKQSVIAYGKSILGDKFIPITEFMSFDDYNLYMACIDIAIFNHDRQQAMGNTIGLLSLGKKVVMKPTVTPFNFFTEIVDINIYTIDDASLLEPLSGKESLSNTYKIKDYFNKERLIENWMEVFDEQ